MHEFRTKEWTKGKMFFTNVSEHCRVSLLHENNFILNLQRSIISPIDSRTPLRHRETTTDSLAMSGVK